MNAIAASMDSLRLLNGVPLADDDGSRMIPSEPAPRPSTPGDRDGRPQLMGSARPPPSARRVGGEVGVGGGAVGRVVLLLLHDT